MRWKLLLIASLLATLVGAGGTLGIIGFFGFAKPFASQDRLIFATLLVPVAAITAASIFVYRHTARRRPLQAMMTALLACVLTLAVLILSSMLFAKRASPQQPAPQPLNIV